MKIRKLVIKNINSLYGMWEIDFTVPEYAAGLFAITGSTGSGKSTILDAMCLALFAETPRIGHGENKEIVSRGTNECLAELTFEADGACYMASFSYSPITRGKRAGQINDLYAHRLVRNGTEIADKTSAVRKLVEEITGLDRERFTRTVMLAQGKFDAFLNAGDAKAAILEQITGTGIYSRIAGTVKQLFDQANEQLAQIRAVCGGIVLLSPEEEAVKQEYLAELEHNRNEMQKEALLLSGQLKIVETLEKLAVSLNENTAAQAALQQETTDFLPDQLRLTRGRKTEPARNLYNTWKELQHANAETFAELEQLEQTLPTLKQLAEQTEKQAESALSTLQEQQLQHEELLKKINSVRLLDASIRETKTQSERLKKNIEKEGMLRTAAENRITRTADARKKLEERHKASEQYCRDHAADSSLPEKAAEWTGSLRHLVERRSVALTLNRDRELAEKKVTTAEKTLTTAENDLKNAEEKCKTPADAVIDLQKKIGSHESRQSLTGKQNILMRNIRTIRAITDLADERNRLRKGEPCPLCGATEHPFADHPDVIPTMDQNEKDLAEVSRKLEELTALEGALRDAENARFTADAEREKAAAAKEIARNTHAHAIAERDEKQRLFEEEVRAGKTQWNQLKKMLEDAGFELPEKAVSLPDTVSERIERYRDAEKNLQEFSGNLAKIQAEQNAAELEKQGIGQRLAEAETELKEHLEKLQNLSAERFALLGNRDPEQEQACADAALKSAADLRIHAEKEAVRTAEEWKNARTQQEKLQAEAGKRSLAIHESELALAEICRKIGIPPETLENDLLDPAGLAQLSAKEADLAARKQNLEIGRKKLTEEQKAAENQRKTEKDAATLSEELHRKTEEQNQLSITLGALRQELDQNAENRKRLAEKEAELESRKKNAALWGRLHNLIGKGNQFQRVAQGITLDNLLTLANGELRSLYERYELIRSEKEQLGIDVIDHEQGDEIRTCANLSGGERFVVSLALALGLSRMAGEKIRIDSFFLDEGFGTLDSESLQIVMHALSKLHSGGKLVGVISHVSNLADEIPCAISVTKNGGGKSSLSGPGVTQK